MRRAFLYLIIYIGIGLHLAAQDLTYRDESLATALATLRDAQTKYDIHWKSCP